MSKFDQGPKPGAPAEAVRFRARVSSLPSLPAEAIGRDLGGGVFATFPGRGRDGQGSTVIYRRRPGDREHFATDGRSSPVDPLPERKQTSAESPTASGRAKFLAEFFDAAAQLGQGVSVYEAYAAWDQHSGENTVATLSNSISRQPKEIDVFAKK